MCRPTDNVQQIFLKSGWDIICGPAQDRPLRAAEDSVAIYNIFKIGVELMFRYFSWLEVETVLSFGGFATDKVEIT